MDLVQAVPPDTSPLLLVLDNRLALLLHPLRHNRLTTRRHLIQPQILHITIIDLSHRPRNGRSSLHQHVRLTTITTDLQQPRPLLGTELVLFINTDEPQVMIIEIQHGMGPENQIHRTIPHRRDGITTALRRALALIPSMEDRTHHVLKVPRELAP